MPAFLPHQIEYRFIAEKKGRTDSTPLEAPKTPSWVLHRGANTARQPSWAHRRRNRRVTDVQFV